MTKATTVALAFPPNEEKAKRPKRNDRHSLDPKFEVINSIGKLINRLSDDELNRIVLALGVRSLQGFDRLAGTLPFSVREED